MAQAQTARNLALLRDEEIVMKPENAEKFAAEHTFDWLLAQVAAWWVDPTRAQYGTGGLVNRIGGKWATGHFPESFRRTDLYLRHAVLESPWSDTAAEDDDLPDLAFDPAPPLAPPLPDPDPDSEEAKVWAEVLAELALQMTAATFETWVRNTRLIQLDREDGESYAATIQVPNAYAQSWLDGRLFSTVKRTLGGILKHSVAPKFVVLDTERKETVTP